MDAMTQASMAVSEMAPVLQAVHENLQKLSKSLQTQVAALVMARTGSTRSLIIRAATLWFAVVLGLTTLPYVFRKLAARRR